MLAAVSREPTNIVINSSNNNNNRNQFKETSILRWLNPFHTSTNNSNNTISSNRAFIRRSTPNLGNQISKNSEFTTDDSIEYRGVEGLKQFWNRRISLTSNRERSEIDRNHTKNNSNLTSSNSIDCLINRHYSIDSAPPVSTAIEHSVELREKNTAINEEGHRKRDNFYKYKTAATKKRLSLESNTTTTKTTINTTNDYEIKLNKKTTSTTAINNNGINFPLIASTAKGEKIHWAKREDIFINRKQKPQQDTTKLQHFNNINRNINKTNTDSFLSSTNCCKRKTDNDITNNTNENCLMQSNRMAIKSSEKLSTTTTNVYTKTTDAIGTEAMTMPSLKRDITDKASEKQIKTSTTTTLPDRNQNNSTTNCSDSPSRKKTTNSTARRYSFKTHATKTLFSPRKMTATHHLHHHHHYHSTVGNKVAALTSQFNQMVERDSGILEEVKKKNGVLMARAGHVYKIKEETDNLKKKPAKRITSNDSDDGSIKSAKKRLSHRKGHDGGGTVSARIRKFEGESLMDLNVKEKPKIPEKSEQVLMRTKDIQNLKNMHRKSKPTTIDLQLEEIKEEIKTPIQETKELVTESATTTTTIPDETKEECDESKPKIECNNDGNSENDKESLHLEKKTRYARIYERIRFRAPFFSNKKLQELRLPQDNQTLQQSPDQKIKDAINSIEKKLENLTKIPNEIDSIKTDDQEDSKNHNNKFQPNQSFLFRMKQQEDSTINEDEFAPDMSTQQTTLVEAVNVLTINKTESLNENQLPAENIVRSDGKEIDYAKICKQIVIKNNDEELYEPIGAHKTDNIIKPQKSFLYTQMNQQNTKKEHDNIYQTIAEAKAEQKLLYDAIKSQSDEQNDVNDDSYENYESVTETSYQTEDGYEICDPPKINSPRTSDIQRNTTDELPAIPQPQRIIPKINVIINESVTGGQLPPPPPRPKKSPLLTRTQLPEIPKEQINDDDDYNDENIYDTIKGSDLTNCYEILGNGKINLSPKSPDTESLLSNCYETISSVRKFIMSADALSTSSSDHKTNSLYGMPMNSGNNSVQQTDGSSDNNSDDWVDISDGDEDGTKQTKQQFIVVRERTKCHRSPDWSKRVRDQRIQQQSHNYYDDDSDHYYEPLFPSSIEQNSEMPATKQLNISDTNLTFVGSHDKNLDNYQNTKTENLHRQHHHHHHHHRHHHHHHHRQSNAYSDDYDSFDTDDETDEEVKKNDSGVDISNTQLPDPPPSTNRIYACIKKVKNILSTKKVANSPKTPTNTNGKSYENTQFYVNPMEYQNSKYSSPSSDSKKMIKKKSPTIKTSTKKSFNADSSDPYENTEFHAPPKITIPKPKLISKQSSPPPPSVETVVASSPNDESKIINASVLNHSTSSTSNKEQTSDEAINRRKSKSEKSFKSKLKKSFASSHHSADIQNRLNSNRSTFYISDSVDLDSGIFEKTINTPPSIDDKIVEDTTDTVDDKKSEVQQQQQTEIIDRTLQVTRKSKRNLRSPDLMRRRTTIGIRPNNPPPPPPIDKKSCVQHKPRPTASWYAECGVFKTNGFGDELRGERNSNSSWYADAGLYQTSGASVASSSGSSGVSTGGEGCNCDDNNSHSMFLNEPLYQIYSAAKLESISCDMEDQDSQDGYEEIGTHLKKTPRPTALQLVGPKQGPTRTLWSEVPEVINSEILSTLTSTERSLQEAKFEVLTSEASYLKSLNLLRTHFINSSAFRDPAILNPSDRKTLFSHIVPVHDCSDRLLSDLEKCWQDNIMLIGLSKSIFKNAEKYFHVYISFCEHQGKMDRTLRRLKEQNREFSQKLEQLERDPVCCSLNLHSFLIMLPMQRITRLPLLIDAVFSKVKADDDEYENWKMTLAILNKIVAQCNEAAKRCEQAYEIERISRQIEFPSNIRSLAIAPIGVPLTGVKPRTLVKRGEFVQLVWRGDDAKLTFGKKISKCNIYAFLFTDLLILTKKKSDEQYVVVDYCPRSMLTISSGDAIPQLPIKDKDLVQSGKHLILMTLLENHEGKTIEMVLSCSLKSDQQRWLETTATPESENPDEKLYEQWDCPQVIAKHDFIATEPDLLSLEAGDVVNVTRKMQDGWYQGERIRDGICGWFPGNFTEEVNSAHVRARNLKQRYRLLTFTASYLEMQKRK